LLDWCFRINKCPIQSKMPAKHFLLKHYLNTHTLNKEKKNSPKWVCFLISSEKIMVHQSTLEYLIVLNSNQDTVQIKLILNTYLFAHSLKGVSWKKKYWERWIRKRRGLGERCNLFLIYLNRWKA
jgi:hypothetical protein